MREIKFRAKSGTQWRYGDLYHNERGELMIYEPQSRGKTLEGIPYDGWRLKVDPETVGQYTGLKDCEGREIYEGDIVKLLPQFSVKQGLKRDFHLPVVVKWDERFARFSLRSMEIIDNICHNEYITVIGNIYDNPELLE